MIRTLLVEKCWYVIPLRVAAIIIGGLYVWSGFSTLSTHYLEEQVEEFTGKKILLDLSHVQTGLKWTHSIYVYLVVKTTTKTEYGEVEDPTDENLTLDLHELLGVLFMTIGIWLIIAAYRKSADKIHDWLVVMNGIFVLAAIVRIFGPVPLFSEDTVAVGIVKIPTEVINCCNQAYSWIVINSFHEALLRGDSPENVHNGADPNQNVPPNNAHHYHRCLGRRG